MQQPPKKNYYKLTPDAPTASDKKRISDLAKELEKEDFYGKKKPKTGSYLTKVYKTVRVEKPKESKVSVTESSPLMRARSAKKQ